MHDNLSHVLSLSALEFSDEILIMARFQEGVYLSKPYLTIAVLSNHFLPVPLEPKRVRGVRCPTHLETTAPPPTYYSAGQREEAQTN